MRNKNSKFRYNNFTKAFEKQYYIHKGQMSYDKNKCNAITGSRED